MHIILSSLFLRRFVFNPFILLFYSQDEKSLSCHLLQKMLDCLLYENTKNFICLNLIKFSFCGESHAKCSFRSGHNLEIMPCLVIWMCTCPFTTLTLQMYSRIASSVEGLMSRHKFLLLFEFIATFIYLFRSLDVIFCAGNS